jgi:hypothetical protein
MMYDMKNSLCYILGYIKITKSDKFIVLKYALFTIIRFTHLSFLCYLEYGEFHTEFLQVCSVHHCLYNILKHQNMNFEFLNTKRYM